VGYGGFGSAVLEVLGNHALTGVSVLRHALPDDVIEHGAQGVLRRDYGLDEAGIADKIRQLHALRQRDLANTL
jgi:deoxyxylulose-5-phosphate synthase